MISVCIPTYNGENYIKQQILSILNELGEDDEIVISDDGSTDMTLAIIEEINDKRIIVIKNEENIQCESYNNRTEKLLKKVSLNLQNALLPCKGDYIYLADQDDIWKKGRITNTLPLLAENKPILVVCDCCVVDENNTITQRSYFDYVTPSQNLWRTVIKSSFHGCCMCFNRILLAKAFPFPQYSLGHDLWIGLIAIKFGLVYFCPEVLVEYRRHSTTVTSTGSKSKNSFGFKIRYRIMLLIEYLKLYKRK